MAKATRQSLPEGDPQAYCTALTKASGSNFYYAFLPLPKARREALFVIYAFCRHADDIVDETESPAQAEAGLLAWRAEWQAALDGHPMHPITVRLREVVAGYDIDPTLPFELLDGMAMDIGPVRYPDFDHLALYCHRAASVVGLMCIRVFGCHHPDADAFACAHGMAFQLTNILRDVGGDAARNRIYLPEDDLKRFGVSGSDLLEGRDSPELRALKAFEAARARGYYAEARRIARTLPKNDRKALLPSRIMGAIYGALLEEMSDRDFAPESGVSLSTPRKLWLAGRAWVDHLLDRW
ncbi:MAG: presqualene diphosphate synthase HpnD [Leptospirillia bacterium]